MKAVVIHARNDLRIEEKVEAASPESGEVRIDTVRGGICGSDLHYFHEGGFGAVQAREPMIIGHEVSGVAAQVGRNVWPPDMRGPQRLPLPTCHPHRLP